MSGNTYIFDRTSSTNHRDQFFDPLFFQIHNSNSRICHHLVSRKYQAIASDILHVDREIRYGLRSIHEKKCIFTKFGFYFFDVVDLSGNIGDMSDGNDFYFITIFLIKIIPIDLVFLVDVKKFYFESFSFCQNLPRKDIRMMLSNSEQHYISGLEYI